MVRVWFIRIFAGAVGILGLGGFFWAPLWWLLIVISPLLVLGLIDALQFTSTIRRNFPLVGRLRYMLEGVRPEIQQYFIETNIVGHPIEREFRSVVYQRAKKELETLPFGTQRDVYRVGYEWAAHSMAPVAPLESAPRIRIGGPDCTQPYDASLLNISAMSFGALSKNAIQALNAGAKLGGFAHNTGEGGVSPYHLKPGGDLIWQIGTGYFGCRTKDGKFDPEQFAEQATHPAIKMIELKISQGAKPGHGGILPAAKVTQEIADIRGVSAGETVFSPPCHTAFSTPIELMEFIAQLRELAEGKPIGFKVCLGHESEFMAVAKAMLATELTPDFISIDGGEGGTGAAPLEFSNSLGMPARDAWIFAHSVLRGVDLRDRIKIIASGKILTGFHMVRAMALGADLCASARGMMFALGCIQALRCNTDNCPTGVATQKPALVEGLHVPSKTQRVANYHAGTIDGMLELLGAMGHCHPNDLTPHRIFRRIDDMHVKHYDELYDFLEPGQLLQDKALPDAMRQEWNEATAERWTSETSSSPASLVV